MAINNKRIMACIPDDHSDQVDAEYYVRQLDGAGPLTFVDLGCGRGNSYEVVRNVDPHVSWIGLDIMDSAEARSRSRTDVSLVSFDGIRVPLADDCVDVVYSRQVFEHVRHPERLLAEIHRVLRPGGRFIGSVSQLEPLHSRSFWNFTYFGFATLATDAGLSLVEFRPGIDGPTLVLRNLVKFQLKQDGSYFNPFFASSSPLNTYLDKQLASATHRERNRAKITYAGHVCFKFRKPETPARH